MTQFPMRVDGLFIHTVFEPYPDRLALSRIGMVPGVSKRLDRKRNQPRLFRVGPWQPDPDNHPSGQDLAKRSPALKCQAKQASGDSSNGAGFRNRCKCIKRPFVRVAVIKIGKVDFHSAF